MIYYQLAAWSVILGLSFMALGGLVLWAYGARRRQTTVTGDALETASVASFHTRITRWIFMYGTGLILGGAVLLMWAGSVFL